MNSYFIVEMQSLTEHKHPNFNTSLYKAGKKTIWQ